MAVTSIATSSGSGSGFFFCSLRAIEIGQMLSFSLYMDIPLRGNN
jgi:hypothetical protein